MVKVLIRAVLAAFLVAIVYSCSLPAKYLVKERPYELDVDRMLKESKFKIKPNVLIERARQVVKNKINTFRSWRVCLV